LKENKIIPPHCKRPIFSWEDSSTNLKFVSKIISTNEKLLIKPQKEILKQLRVGVFFEDRHFLIGKY